MKNRNLGKKCTDIVTGFSGIIVGFCQYLTGCDQYLVSPKTDDPNKKPEPHWFDSNRLEILPEVVISLKTDKEQGPDRAAPKY